NSVSDETSVRKTGWHLGIEQQVDVRRAPGLKL
ncbi:unnamed protein product, partial [marine sediment metagenome]